MNQFIKMSFGLVLGIATLSSSAQTTRTLFTGGATVGTGYNIGYSFNDPSCRSVTSRLSYLAGPLEWFDSKVYCAGITGPVLTFTYSQYGYPSPSPIKSCSITRGSNPNLLFYHAANCSAYVGVTEITPPVPITRDLFAWVPMSQPMPTYSWSDTSCHATFATDPQGQGYTGGSYSSVYCNGIEGAVVSFASYDGGRWFVRSKHAKAIVTETSNSGFVKFQIN
ncbi:hypothetical protein [Cellvibrio sp. UBA7671]|uniref:hypothetical protein n=1 Tax=Cellvibrio sp. UBA7671 TaxID=1946312 RepID=UPI002F35B78D